MNTIETFFQKVNQTETCWLWLGTLRCGYGRFNYQGKKVSAHRFAYEHLKGPIPDGLELDHLCKITKCVNPEHLEIVTRTINVRRSKKPHCPKGHLWTVENTYHNPRGFKQCRQCDRERIR